MTRWITWFWAAGWLAAAAVGQRTPVVVELFTSEGCSSCPAADELLLRLDEAQPFPGVEIIALSQHVDYWNRLGWRDPFSAAEFTGRQQQYRTVFHTANIYTPQMVIDGRVELVGSDSGKAQRAIVEAAREPKVGVRLEIVGDRLRVEVEALPQQSAEVLLAITENGLQSSVARGENAGRRLRHTAVVRRLTVLGKTGPQPFSTEVALSLDPAWKRENLRAVVLVQDRNTRRICGTGQRPVVQGQ